MIEEVMLEPEDTPLGEFQKERTDAISEMFDGKDECGIYPTTKFFIRLDNCVRKLLGAQQIYALKKPDRPDREKIAPIICKVCGLTEENNCVISEGGCVELPEYLDEILALFDEPKPDEGRLLTPKEIGDALDLEGEGTYPRSDGSVTYCINVDEVCKKQDAKTASMVRDEWRQKCEDIVAARHEVTSKAKDKECQERVERILKSLPEIPARFDHNKTCFDCVNKIREQAKLSEEMPE